MLQNYLIPELIRLLTVSLRFSAPCHLASQNRQLEEVDPPWSPRSPDLTSLNSFVCCHLKITVYAIQPRSIDDELDSGYE